jgi:MFS family permease
MTSEPKTASAWSPFQQSVFRNLWIATVASNVGTWMQSVGAAWLMTSLSKSAILVALVQAASSLPLFLLALPAGALADIVDRRRLLLLTQVWMTVIAAILGALTLLNLTTPGLLLGLTFVLGLGAALNAPAWQAIVPELVPRRDLPQAISLNSAGFNLSRAIGPAAGGAVVAAAGAGATFILNAVSFLGVLLVLYYWRREVTETVLPGERMVAAMYAGVRYVRHSLGLRAILVRAGLVMAFSSSMFALLPLVARYELASGPSGFGILLGAFGAGAVVGAVAMPGLRRFLSGELLNALCTLVLAAMTAVMALVPLMWAVAVALFVGGAAWLILVSAFNVAVQLAVPAWIRARALAVYMLVFFGALTLGSAVWGVVASHQSLKASLLYSGAGLVLSLLAMIRYRLEVDEETDLRPSLHWPEPHVVLEPQPEQGPVLVILEYQVDPADTRPFLKAMHTLSAIRRRDGAIRWGVFQDIADPGRFVETYVVETWIEHLRQHERLTKADRDIERRVLAYHKGPVPPPVSHLLYAYGPRGRARRRFIKSLGQEPEKE